MFTTTSSAHGLSQILPLVLTLFHLQTALFFRPGFSLSFDYLSFPRNTASDFDFPNEESYIIKEAIQVTPDLNVESMFNKSGRVLFKTPFRLWNRRTQKTASFNSTFDLNITPQTPPHGEGIAFIIAGDVTIPANSSGKWLGIANSTTNGSSVNSVVAVEFDTRKSYTQDVDGNHVGLDINSPYSILQVPLGSRGVNLSSGTDVTAVVEYDGGLKRVTVSVFMKSDGKRKDSEVFNESLDLTKYLPEKVFLGFAASTGEGTELNCVRAWSFSGQDIEGDDGKKLIWVWVMIAVVLSVFLGGLMGYCHYYKKRKHEPDLEEDQEDQNEDPMLELEIQSSTRSPKRFRLKELKSATGDFSPKNELGRGGFGTVFKGVLNNNKVVAVKRFSKRSEHGKADFVAEVKTIGNLNHKNLVKLVGWCHESSELLLVYEFMPNGSLDKFIFQQRDSNPADVPELTLDWGKRHGIICGVGSALDYLHNGCEKRVLHRDIKASNILLDSDFNARLGDFGLARTIQFSDQTHHSTKELAGTPGYMAPESFHTGRATAETDVYAFGVLVLEAVCGRKPGFQHELNNFSNGIVDWVWERHRRDSLIDVVDFNLLENEDFQQAEVERVLLLGLACCNPNPYRRPSMRTGLQVLTGEVAPPEVPIEKPAFMWPASLPPSFEHQPPDQSFSSAQYPPSTVISAR